MHIDIQLYNLIGQKIATLKNEFVSEGYYQLYLKDVMSIGTLAPGQYLYRITNFEGAFSKIIVVK